MSDFQIYHVQPILITGLDKRQCKETKTGLRYTGNMSYTSDGRKCLRLSDVYPTQTQNITTLSKSVKDSLNQVFIFKSIKLY